MMSQEIAKEYLTHKESLEKVGYRIIGTTYDKEGIIILIKEKK